MIAWPLAAAVPPRAGADLSLHEERRRTILLIEDDVAIANMYRFQLASDGFRVIQAFDGVQGLNAVFERRPDLVLLDVRLPGMEGFAVLERIRSEPALAATPVVILSNFSEPAMLEHGLALGAIDYLVKSRISPHQLSLKVRGLLGGELSD